MNRRVDIREDIKRYQDTLSYALSKVDYSVGLITSYLSLVALLFGFFFNESPLV